MPNSSVDKDLFDESPEKSNFSQRPHLGARKGAVERFVWHFDMLALLLEGGNNWRMDGLAAPPPLAVLHEKANHFPGLYQHWLKCIDRIHHRLKKNTVVLPCNGNFDFWLPFIPWNQSKRYKKAHKFQIKLFQSFLFFKIHALVLFLSFIFAGGKHGWRPCTWVWQIRMYLRCVRWLVPPVPAGRFQLPNFSLHTLFLHGCSERHFFWASVFPF